MNDTASSEPVNIDLSQFPALNLTGAHKMLVKQPVTARFKPLPDITAWELAQILPGLFGKAIYEEDWVALGSTTRHFERLDQPTSDEPTVTA